MQLIRIFFTKQDEASYISHLDLQRVMARALRRSGIPVWYSQGFNPHIYMSFALPLPLMHHSLCEAVDCKTEAENVDFTAYIEPLNQSLPRGITVTGIAPPQFTANEIGRAVYTITYPAPPQQLQAALESYNQSPTAMALRKTKRSEGLVDLKEYVPSLTANGDGQSFTVALPAGGTLNYSPELLCGFLRESCGLAGLPHILRQKVYTRDGKEFK